MGMFEQFPYSNFHELNLDWLIEQLNYLKSTAVMSVNGQTGDVILYQDPNVEFPALDSGAWRIFRTVAGAAVGVAFANGKMYLVDGGTLEEVYTANNQPAYPVTSVNGQTGNVVTYPDAANNLPTVPEGYTNFTRTIDSEGTPASVGLQVDKTKIQRIKDLQRIDVYDADNQPPYPVTSVNGQTGTVTGLYDANNQPPYPVTSVNGNTGAVTGLYDASNPPPYPVTSVNNQTGAVVLAIPFNAPLSGSVWQASENSSNHEAGFSRFTQDGEVAISLISTGSDVEAHIFFTSNDEQTYFTRKLLTIDDVPTSSVVSVNGQGGIVVLRGSDIEMNSGDSTKLDVAINNKAKADECAFVISGNMCSDNVTEGNYVIVRGSTITGVVDGLYQAANNVNANTAFVAADLTPVSGGGFNALNDKITKVETITTSPNTVTVNSGVVKKINNIVWFHFSGLKTQWAEHDVIATVPDGYRPPYAVHTFAINYNMPSDNVQVVIGTDGVVKIWNKGTQAEGNIYIDTMWFVV